MPTRTSKTGSELFIVDNSDEDWKALRYLHDWCQLSKGIDIATGFFEIGSLLGLDGEWQKVDQFRILMGDELTRRTKQALTEGVRARLEASLEAEKEKNDFLTGVPAVVAALRAGKIQCRVYRKRKFHAKAYITHHRMEVVGSFGLVGSSNFTFPGLTENVELNVQISGSQVKVLQEWYEDRWNDAEDITPEVLRTIERHVREYSPFEVYAKALQEFFKGHEMSADEWELAGPQKGGSRMYPVLDQYQKEGYRALLKIARRYGGAFLCDGVGLGKTFVGLMLIERLAEQEGKRVVLLVPKVSREPVWEQAIRHYLPHMADGDFSNLVVFNHTDLQRGGRFPARFRRIAESAHAIVIDEAHHFRNPGIWGEGSGIQAERGSRPSRYRHLFDLIDGPGGAKQVYLLTATPINNRLIDLQHMIELFSRRQQDYFKTTLGIHSLQGHFRKMEKDLEQAVDGKADAPPTETDLAEAEKVLAGDTLFQELVVQRSRAYVRESQLQEGGALAIFPQREEPKVAPYSVKKTYGKLLAMVDDAFKKEKPLFSLAIYYPLHYYRGDDKTVDPFAEGRQKQVVGLIRTQFLKRFESSAHAFACSCDRLLVKLLAFAQAHSETAADKTRLERWLIRHKDLIGYVHDRQRDLFGGEDDEPDEDLVSDEMLAAVERLPRADYQIDEMLNEVYNDLDQIIAFLHELRKFEAKHDDKLKALLKLLKGEPVLGKHKILIFSEFADTARYLESQLKAAGIDGVEEIDSGSKRDGGDVIARFAPYYNGSSSGELAARGKAATRVLISTDVLSEGLNLQDATRLINYDLHWNPVRLMQRIGRVDRRLNPQVESKLLADHPDQQELRGRVAYWNFLPPDELDELLRLYGRVAHKTLRISKTFGIEGRKLLRPEDDYEALKNFNHEYEGTKTPIEDMHLEYQRLLQEFPDLADRLNALPGRVFSGKRHPAAGARAVFFCYALPAVDHAAPAAEAVRQRSLFGGDSAPAVQQLELPWTEAAGRTSWYLYDLATEKILEDPAAMIDLIRCRPDTPRHCELEPKTLKEIRAQVEKHIGRTYLRSVQAPQGVKPVLKAWLELC